MTIRLGGRAESATTAGWVGVWLRLPGSKGALHIRTESREACETNESARTLERRSCSQHVQPGFASCVCSRAVVVLSHLPVVGRLVAVVMRRRGVRSCDGETGRMSISCIHRMPCRGELLGYSHTAAETFLRSTFTRREMNVSRFDLWCGVPSAASSSSSSGRTAVQRSSVGSVAHIMGGGE
jgi:hypothetical protein